jgi:hypothetical protein
VLLALPRYSKWCRAVRDAAAKAGVGDIQRKRIEELLAQTFGEGHCRRRGTPPDDPTASWQENAEREYDRRPFEAILNRCASV